MILNINNYVDKKHITKLFLKTVLKNFYNSLLNIDEIDEETAKEAFISYVSKDEDKMASFFNAIDELKETVLKDIQFTFDSDPACNSYEEVLSTYPGFLAILYYRIAHILYNLDLKLVARIIAEDAHKKTGIDINPGATIGVPFFIDHGTGIVIGETSIIGNYCKIYQGVTLGALSLARGQQLKSTKRHPTIGDRVTIYAGAAVLGGDVVIGDDVIIGSNVFLMDSVANNTKVILPKSELCFIKRTDK